MTNNFKRTLKYLQSIRQTIYSDESDLPVEEKISLIIQNAVLTDSFNRGSIIFTKKDGKYYVSGIQRYSYAWPLKDQEVDIEKIITTCQELGVDFNLEPSSASENSNRKNDYELSFEVQMPSQQIRKKIKT